MAALNLSCVICIEFYKNADEIVTTGCGHVFHKRCLEEWRQCAVNCPSCRAFIRTTCRLYLNFEEWSFEKDKQVAELKSMMNQYIEQNSLLQQQLEQNERDFQQLQNEIKILQDKNKQFWNELNKIKLKSMLEHTKSGPPTRNETNQNPNTTNAEQRGPKIVKNSYTNSELSDFSTTTAINGCIQSVIIKNVKVPFTNKMALLNYVIHLTNLMDLFYTVDDLEQVTLLDQHQQGTVSLVAKFKNVSLKAQFLLQKEKLKLHMDTKNVTVCGHVDGDTTKLLFIYAKTLKPLGFKYIYCINNIIFVKKEDGGEPIRIKSHADVDRLKSEIENLNT